MKMKACEAMVECLKAENIKVVFGYPGAAICPFYDALMDSGIKHVLVRHEANAGHEASGMARITGRPAVCVVTSGPGAVNLITAIATAYADSIPIVCITGQVNTDQIGSDVFQEADITGAAEPFVKHSYLVKDPRDIPRVFKEAFYIAGSGRPGPVLIDMPMDVQRAEIDFKYPKSVDIRSYRPTLTGNAFQVKRVMAELEKAKKPLICIGGGVFAAGAQEEVVKLAHTMNIPVITTMMGISVFSDDDPLFFGMLGSHGVPAANKAVNECDVLFLVGARVGDRAVRTPLELEQTTKILHIDIDPAELGKNIRVDFPLVGDAKIVLGQLLERAKPADHSEWLAQLEGWRIKREYAPAREGTVVPRQFIEKLSRRLPDNTVVVADVGQNQIWTATSFRIGHGGRFMTSGGMGTMGYSLPAAIGAKIAAPERPVIAVCGDGSLQMCMMELATAVQNDVKVKIVVMTNNRLGMVRELQTNGYNGREIGVFLDGSPDFIKIAEAYGIKSCRVTDDKSAEEAIELLAGYDGTALVEVMVDENEKTL
ncbi:acetolactate synthase, large subunit [Ruminococcaceae bacterium FB2012]|nr:acetolactate synthase, large subunit [Ruminococcaceae bacterium FB2012]